MLRDLSQENDTSSIGGLFQMFRDGRGRTKSELAALTGLSRSTVSSRLDALITANLLIPAGSELSSGGRPPARLVMNTEAGFVLGVDLGATHAMIAITDLAANVLASESVAVDIGLGPEAILNLVLDIGDRLSAAIRKPKRFLGVGMGLPGAVEHATGRPINPPIMPGWDGFDVPALVRRRFSGDVHIDNDVNILALGEHALSWPTVDDLIFVKVATGLGAGIISGGLLQRGANGTAGDIGYVQVAQKSRGHFRPDGDERNLGDLASGMAIARELMAQGIPARTAEDVVGLIRVGNPAAVSATRQAGREVGEVLAILVNTLNPSVIVVGGSVGRAGEHLLAGIREVVYRRAMPIATRDLSIVPSAAGDRAGVRGAAMLVLQHALSASGVEAAMSGRP